MLWVEESIVSHRDDGRSYRIFDGEPEESYFDTVGELFRYCQKEYGRCVSKVYIDTVEKTICVGWCFQKRMPFQDAPNETYLHETWITVHDAPPTKTIEYHYHEIAA